MPTPSKTPVLVVVAAPIEARSVRAGFDTPAGTGTPWRVCRLAPGFSLLETGVGKVNAGASLARAMSRGRYRAVLNLGIAGALPGTDLSIGDVVLASSSVYADEGLLSSDGFTTCAGLGFPLGPFEGNAVPADPDLLRSASACLSSWTPRAAPVATVSTCSGTDAMAMAVREQTGAIAEGMEGAALGHTAARFSDEFPRRACPFLEVRVISNTTGERRSQRWDIPLAMRRLAGIARAMGAGLSTSESAPGV